MIFQEQQIVRDVRVCLNENARAEAFIQEADEETLLLEETIRQKICEGVDRVHKIAPIHLLEGRPIGRTVFWADKESGWIPLPDDFMRLVVFEMDDWHRAVYRLTEESDAEYEKQRSRIKGIRGTAEKPVCLLGMRNEGLVLEFYSCKSEDAVVKRGLYMPFARWDRYDGVNISEGCYRAAVYMTASLVAYSRGEMEKGTQLKDKAETLIKNE